MFRKYINYLKNNPEGYWFKRKLYGWGWTPARWQGWVCVLVYLLIVVRLFLTIDATSHSGSDTLIGMSLPFIVITVLFILLCYAKGEPPRWQWGEKDTEETPKK
jgi:uncharacterized membrane protein YhaH (DUF805 family)